MVCIQLTGHQCATAGWCVLLVTWDCERGSGPEGWERKGAAHGGPVPWRFLGWLNKIEDPRTKALGLGQVSKAQTPLCFSAPLFSGSPGTLTSFSPITETSPRGKEHSCRRPCWQPCWKRLLSPRKVSNLIGITCPYLYQDCQGVRKSKTE